MTRRGEPACSRTCAPSSSAAARVNLKERPGRDTKADPVELVARSRPDRRSSRRSRRRGVFPRRAGGRRRRAPDRRRRPPARTPGPMRTARRPRVARSSRSSRAPDARSTTRNGWLAWSDRRLGCARVRPGRTIARPPGRARSRGSAIAQSSTSTSADASAESVIAQHRTARHRHGRSSARSCCDRPARPGPRPPRRPGDPPEAGRCAVSASITNCLFALRWEASSTAMSGQPPHSLWMGQGVRTSGGRWLDRTVA